MVFVITKGHFTQMVWKSSKEFGIGKAQGKDGKWIVVGNYFPAGNMLSRNAENVFPVGGPKAGAGSGITKDKIRKNKQNVKNIKNKTDKDKKKDKKKERGDKKDKSSKRCTIM